MDRVGGEQTGQTSSIKQVAAASFIGTTIEWYDFFLYGTAAALVFGQLFFPYADPLIGTLSSFATFAVAFIARPFGGALFGHYGDRMGRKTMLVITLLMMGIGTFLIGCLPTFESVGILAPILLVVLRTIQGIALGGEWGGAVLMAVEHATPGRRGFYGSWPQIGAPAGLFLGTLVFEVFASLPQEQFLAWGWRVPFLLSIVLVGVGLFIRLRILETPAFTQMKESQTEAQRPLLDVIRDQPKTIVLATGMRLSENVSFYVVTVFALSFGTQQLGIDRTTMLTGILISAALGFLAMPAFGALSDKIGRRPVYLGGAVLSALLAFPFFWALETKMPILIWIAFVVIMNTAHDAQYGVQGSYLAELFGTRVRYSGASLGSQLGGVFGGGFAPLIATALLAAGGGSPVYVATYLTGMCLLTVLATYLAPETYQSDIAEESPQETGVFAGGQS